MTAVELLPPGEAVHGNERWMELRRQGVTASEIAQVMGISKWGSPFSLYWQKVNGWQGEDNEIAAAGRHLEASIADWWMAEHDPIENLVASPAGLYAHPDRPWQLATPDRLLRLSDCVGCDGSGAYDSGRLTFGCTDCNGKGGLLAALLECKWVAANWDGWGDPGTDEIPVYYRAQGLWQLDVLGVDEVHFAALGPTGFRSYLLRRDEQAEADLKLMREAAEDFVRRLTEGDVPDLDSHTATLSALKKLHPSVEDGEVEVPVDLAEAYRIARAEKKAAEERVDLLDNHLRDLLAGRRKAVCNGRLVASRSVYERKPYSVGPTTIDKLNPGRAESYGA